MENPKQRKQRQKRNKEIKRLYPDLTLEELAEKYKLSKERIRQILEGIN